MTNFSSRIPASLQAVFLSSNRGNEVNKPPPDQSAFKVFARRFPRKRSAKEVCLTSDATDDSSNTTAASSTSPRQLLAEHLVQTQHVSKRQDKPQEEPQDVLDSLIFARNYDTTPHSSMNTAYCFKPSALQIASYTVHLKMLVRENHISAFSEIIDSGLVSNNPCNQFSESLLHMTARKGHVDQARALLRTGASVQIADDYGRTPLHDLCWCPDANASVFELADLLLQQDARLFYIKDKRGNVPLDYVKDPANKKAWSAYLERKVDVFWPPLANRQGRPPLCLKKPNSLPVMEPRMATNLGLAAVIAAGQLDASDYSSDSDSDDDDDEFEAATASTFMATDIEDETNGDYDDESESESEMDFDDDELLNDMVFRMSAINC